MKMRDYLLYAASAFALAANEYFDAKLNKNFNQISNTKYKGSSTKSGNNPKTIKARRKKNKNKKTHRK